MIGNDRTSLANKSFTNSLLKPPPQKQGTLDTPPPIPKPNALAQSRITQFYQPEEPDLFSKETLPFVDDATTFVRPMDFVSPKKSETFPIGDEFVRPNETPTLKEKPKKQKKEKTPKTKKYLPDDQTINSDLSVYDLDETGNMVLKYKTKEERPIRKKTQTKIYPK